MIDHDDMTPEEMDAGNQELLQDLQRLYAPADEGQMLERVRMRLSAANQEATAHSRSVWQRAAEDGQRTSEQWAHTTRSALTTGRGRAFRWISTIAALLVAALLVGSLLLVLTHARQPGTGAPGGASSQPTKGAGQIKVVGKVQLWFIGWTFNGTGRKTITDLHIDAPYATYAWFSCSGKGQGQVRFNNPETGKGFSVSCPKTSDGHDEDGGQPYKIIVGAPHIIDRLYVVAEPGSSWMLQLAVCSDAACDQQEEPTPTPMPLTPTPMPTPTISPPPTPTPTVIPPTPMPTLQPTQAPLQPTPRPVTPTPAPLQPTPTPAPA
jgi:hypothetical protein